MSGADAQSATLRGPTTRSRVRGRCVRGLSKCSARSVPVLAVPTFVLTCVFHLIPYSRHPAARKRSSSRFRRTRRAGATVLVLSRGARSTRDRVARPSALSTIHPRPDVRRRHLLGRRSGYLWAVLLMYLDSQFVQCLSSLVLPFSFPVCPPRRSPLDFAPRLRFAPVRARLRLRLLDDAFVFRLRSS